MASNQTQHYQLSQWAASDKVERLDFNADNAKIDEALHTLAEQVANKAEQTNLAAAINRVTALENGKAEQSVLNANVDALRSENMWVKLSDVTLSQNMTSYDWVMPDTTGYIQLLCRFMLEGAGATYAKINGGEVLHKANDFATLTEFLLIYQSKQGAGGQLRLYPCGLMGKVACYYETAAVREDSACSGLSSFVVAKTLAFSALKQINFVPESGSFLKGSRFVVYGLKG